MLDRRMLLKHVRTPLLKHGVTAKTQQYFGRKERNTDYVPKRAFSLKENTDYVLVVVQC